MKQDSQPPRQGGPVRSSPGEGDTDNGIILPGGAREYEWAADEKKAGDGFNIAHPIGQTRTPDLEAAEVGDVVRVGDGGDRDHDVMPPGVDQNFLRPEHVRRGLSQRRESFPSTVCFVHCPILLRPDMIVQLATFSSLHELTLAICFSRYPSAFRYYTLPLTALYRPGLLRDANTKVLTGAR